MTCRAATQMNQTQIYARRTSVESFTMVLHKSNACQCLPQSPPGIWALTPSMFGGIKKPNTHRVRGNKKASPIGGTLTVCHTDVDLQKIRSSAFGKAAQRCESQRHSASAVLILQDMS